MPPTSAALTLSPWLYLPLAIVALIALRILYITLLRDRLARTPDRRRCPKCWYDLRSIPTLRCPECGHTARTERALHRSRYRPLLALLALPLLAPLVTYFVIHGDAARAYYAIMPRYTTVRTGSHGTTHWTLKRVRNPAERGMRLRVSTPTAILLDIEDDDISLGSPSWKQTDFPIRPSRTSTATAPQS